MIQAGGIQILVADVIFFPLVWFVLRGQLKLWHPNDWRTIAAFVVAWLINVALNVAGLLLLSKGTTGELLAAWLFPFISCVCALALVNAWRRA